MSIQSQNPATGEVLEIFAETPEPEIDRILGGACAASRAFRALSIAERARPMREAARLLREGAVGYGRTMALEMGKPIAQGEAEAQKCSLVCDYYAENAER